MTRGAWYAVLIAVAAACDRGSKPGSPVTTETDGSSQPAFTVAGVSFAGALSFEDLGAVTSSPPRPIDGLMRHVYAPGTDLTVRFYIPAAVYQGPATYMCGAEQGKLPESYAYCSLTVEHRASADVTATWTTEGAPSGVYGSLAGCSIVVAQDDATIKSGTIACALPFATSTGEHTDTGKSLAVSGSWAYRIF